MIKPNTAFASPSGGLQAIGLVNPRNEAPCIADIPLADGLIARGRPGVAAADAPWADRGSPAPGRERGRPPERAGLRRRYVISDVNGPAVQGAQGLIPAVASVIQGIKVVLTARRGGHITQIPVVVDRRPAQLGG